jgi:hypothetical protein
VAGRSGLRPLVGVAPSVTPTQRFEWSAGLAGVAVHGVNGQHSLHEMTSAMTYGGMVRPTCTLLQQAAVCAALHTVLWCAV